MKFLNILLLTFLFATASCGFVQSFLESKKSDESTVLATDSEIKIIASNKKFKFLPSEIIARPGQVLKIKVINELRDLPIVFSLLKKDEDPVVNAFLGIQAGESKNWWPPEEHLIFKSEILAYNESASFKITMPKEPGMYAFISSYPGQVDAFNGVIKIINPKESVSTKVD